MNEKYTKIFADAAGRRVPSRLEIRADADLSRPVEVSIVGTIGRGIWDDAGVDEEEFIAQLNAIPKGRQIVVGINSSGGSVRAGLGIYHALKRHGGVTTRNDGYAASIASVILCAGTKVICPTTAAVMIHDPWTMVMGNVDELQKAQRELEANASVLVNAYKERTGKSDSEIRAAMKAETWFTGETAKEWNLVDEITAETPDLEMLASAFDPARHPNAPVHVHNIWNSSGRRPAKKETKEAEDIMNKTAILALLKKHGANVAADANDEAILAALNKLVTENVVEASQRDALVTPPTQAQPATSTQASQPVTDSATNNRLAALEAENARMRRLDVERQVDAAITDCRIPASQRDNWVRRALADATVLTDIQALTQRLPGADPVADIEVTGTSLADIGGHFNRLLTEASSSMLRGGSADIAAIGRNSVAAAHFFQRNRSRLLEVLNSVTVPSDLKRNVILQEVMTAFARIILPLQSFSTVFQNVPLEGTDVISVPYFPLVGAASTDWNASNGYVMGDGTQQTKNITVNKRKYQPLSVSSSELARQPGIRMGNLIAANAEKLGYDVWSDILSIVTLANYGAASFVGAAGTFDSADVADLKGVADVANWTPSGRAMVIKSAYDVNILKDTSIKAAYAFGSSEPVTLGSVSKLFGFAYYVAENIPANAQNLVGFISKPSAILVAASPVAPAEDVRGQLAAYQVITHPELGVSLEYRRWGNPDFDQRREVIEFNYGYAVGESAALKRMTSA